MPMAYKFEANPQKSPSQTTRDLHIPHTFPSSIKTNRNKYLKMKVLANLALVAYLSASISALPTPDGSYGNSIIARSDNVADGTDSFGNGDWKKRADDAVDGTDSFGNGDWKKRADDAVDGTDSFGNGDWKKRADDAVDGTDSFGNGDWKKRGEDVADGAASFGSGPW